MGAESFFVKLSVPESVVTVPEFLLRLSDKGLNSKPLRSDQYILDDYLILTVDANEQMVMQEFSIEGCFSWFRECALRIHDILTLIENEIISTELIRYNHVEFNHLLIRDDFVSYLHDLYQEKYADFVNRYGVMNEKCLPSGHFYRFINKRNRTFRSLWERFK